MSKKFHSYKGKENNIASNDLQYYFKSMVLTLETCVFDYSFEASHQLQPVVILVTRV